jgi:hypothetical protein
VWRTAEDRQAEGHHAEGDRTSAPTAKQIAPDAGEESEPESGRSEEIVSGSASGTVDENQ